MCTVKTPKPVPTSQAKDKKVAVLRNPYLDGIDPLVRARKVGVGSFRIDRGSGKDPPLPGAPLSRPAPPPVTRTPPTSGGSSQHRMIGAFAQMLGPSAAGAWRKLERKQAS